MNDLRFLCCDCNSAVVVARRVCPLCGQLPRLLRPLYELDQVQPLCGTHDQPVSTGMIQSNPGPPLNPMFSDQSNTSPAPHELGPQHASLDGGEGKDKENEVPAPTGSMFLRRRLNTRGISTAPQVREVLRAASAAAFNARVNTKPQVPSTFSAPSTVGNKPPHGSTTVPVPPKNQTPSVSFSPSLTDVPGVDLKGKYRGSLGPDPASSGSG